MNNNSNIDKIIINGQVVIKAFLCNELLLRLAEYNK